MPQVPMVFPNEASTAIKNKYNRIPPRSCTRLPAVNSKIGAGMGTIISSRMERRNMEISRGSLVSIFWNIPSNAANTSADEFIMILL